MAGMTVAVLRLSNWAAYTKYVAERIRATSRNPLADLLSDYTLFYDAYRFLGNVRTEYFGTSSGRKGSYR